MKSNSLLPMVFKDISASSKNTMIGMSIIILLSFSLLFNHLIFLGDDCYISFRYAQNLIQGEGLVWNSGEYVEGYTHILWVLWIALNMLLGISPEVCVIATGYILGITVLISTFYWSYSYQKIRSWMLWFVPIALVCNRSFVAWCSGGLATMLFTCLLLIAYLCYIKEQKENIQIPWKSSTVFALAELVRPEAGVFMFTCGLYFLYQVIHSKRSYKNLLWWCLPFILIVGTHFLWRYSYYHEWLPNTFYAKVHGAWWEQSSLYFNIFAEEYNLHYALPLLVYIGWKNQQGWEAPLVLSIFIYLMYVGYVGADRFEFRFLVVILPLYFMLIQRAFYVLAEFMSTLSAIQHQYLLAGIIMIIMLVGSTHPLGWDRSYVHAYHIRWKKAHIATIPRIKHYASMRVEQGMKLKTLVHRKKLPADFKIATGGAGALPFYSQLWTLDYYGLNDVKIARQKVDRRGLIGHETHASIRYMRERGVEAYAILKRFIYDKNDREYRSLIKQAHQKIKTLNRQSQAQGDQDRLIYQCYQVNQHEHFIFATPVSPEIIEQRLAKFTKCPAS